MAHTIIINGEAVRPPHGGDGLTVSHADGEKVAEYSVSYMPPHDLPLEDRVRRSGKIQRLCAKIEAVALGDEGE